MDALLYTMQHQKTDMRYVFICLYLHWHWFLIDCKFAVPAFTAGEKQVSRGVTSSTTCSLGCHDFSVFISTTMFRELVWLQLSLKINFKQATWEYFHFKFVINAIFAKLLWAALNLGLCFKITTFELIIVNDRERSNCNVRDCLTGNHTCSHIHTTCFTFILHKLHSLRE